MVDIKPVFSEIAPFSPERDITRVWVGELLDYEDPITLPTLDRFALFERLAIDWQIYTCLQQRRRAVVRYRWEVEAGSSPGSDPSRLDKKAAEFWRKLLDAAPFDRLTDEALWAVWFGFGVAELNYAKDGQQVILDPSLGEGGIYQGLRVRNRRRFRFHRTGALRLLTPQNQVEGEALPPRKFWTINVGATHSDNPHGQALAIACHRLATLRPEVWRERMRLLKKIAQGSIYGLYSQEEHAAKLNETIRALREGGGGSIPVGTQLQELSLPTSTVADYAAMNQEIDEALAKLILGQVATSEGVAGQHRGEMQHDVRQDLVISDADLVCASFNAGPVTWLTEWNFPGATPPRVYRKIDAPPDQQAEADKDGKVWALGFAPTLERVVEVYGEGYVGAGPDNDLAAIPADRLPSILQIIDKVASSAITIEQGRELVLYALPGITPEIAERLVQEPPEEDPGSDPGSVLDEFLAGGGAPTGEPEQPTPADAAAQPSGDTPPDQSAEFAAPPPPPDPADQLAARLQGEAAPIIEGWIEQIRGLGEGVESLTEFAERIFELYPDLRGEALAEVMGQAQEVASLAGAAEVAEEAGLDDGVEFAAPAKKQKNCTKGKPCKGECISRNKECREDLPPKAAAAAKKVAASAPKKSRTKGGTGATPASAPGDASPTPPPKPPKAKGKGKPADPVVTNSAELESKRADLVARYGKDLVEQSEANTKKLLEDAGVFMKVPTNDVIGLVLEGGFKTAHELGGRPGSPPPGLTGNDYLDARARVEQKVLGVGLDTPGSDRPKYAYLGNAKNLNDIEHLDVEGAYGAITVEFRPEVKDRATFTATDSFKGGIASRVSDPSAASLAQLTSRGFDDANGPIGSQLRSAATAKNLSELARGATSTGNAYLEAQVHGSLGAQDIKALHFRPSSVHDTPTPDVIRRANEQGIEVFVNGKKVGPDYSPEAPPAAGLARALRDGDVDAVASQIRELRAAAQERGIRDADPLQTAFAEQIGYGDKPRLVASEDFDAQIAAGRPVGYRGVADAQLTGTKAEEIQRQLQSGDYFTGSGVIGNGTYAAFDARVENGVKGTGPRDPALVEIAQDTAAIYGGKQGRIIRMMLDEDARIAPSQRVVEMQRKFDAKIQAEVDRVRATVPVEVFDASGAEAFNQRLRDFDSSFELGMNSTQTLPGSTKTKREYVYSYNPSIGGVDADLLDRLPGGGLTNFEGYVTEKIGKKASKFSIDLPPQIMSWAGPKVMMQTFASQEEARAAMEGVIRGYAADLYSGKLRPQFSSQSLRERVEQELTAGRSTRLVKPGDPTPATREAQDRAEAPYAELRRNLSKGWPDTVSSVFAMAQGIDVVSFSRADKRNEKSDAWLNILNRSKLEIDEQIYTQAQILGGRKIKLNI